MPSEHPGEERGLDALLELANMIRFRLDRAGTLVTVDGPVERLWAYTREELLGHQLGTFPIAPTDLPVAEREFEAKLAGEQSFSSYELTTVTKDGRTVTAHVISVPVRENDDIVGVEGIAQVTRSPERPSLPAREAANLTRRQAQILRLLAEGLGTREIARRLSLAETTTRNHISALLHQLGAHSRLEAVVQGLRRRLIELDDA